MAHSVCWILGSRKETSSSGSGGGPLVEGGLIAQRRTNGVLEQPPA